MPLTKDQRKWSLEPKEDFMSQKWQPSIESCGLSHFYVSQGKALRKGERLKNEESGFVSENSARRLLKPREKLKRAVSLRSWGLYINFNLFTECDCYSVHVLFTLQLCLILSLETKQNLPKKWGWMDNIADAQHHRQKRKSTNMYNLCSMPARFLNKMLVSKGQKKIARKNENNIKLFALPTSIKQLQKMGIRDIVRTVWSSGWWRTKDQRWSWSKSTPASSSTSTTSLSARRGRWGRWRGVWRCEPVRFTCQFLFLSFISLAFYSVMPNSSWI